jgi:hypothetical protein
MEKTKRALSASLGHQTESTETGTSAASAPFQAIIESWNKE